MKTEITKNSFSTRFPVTESGDPLNRHQRILSSDGLSSPVSTCPLTRSLFGLFVSQLCLQFLRRRVERVRFPRLFGHLRVYKYRFTYVDMLEVELLKRVYRPPLLSIIYGPQHRRRKGSSRDGVTLVSFPSILSFHPSKRINKQTHFLFVLFYTCAYRSV